MRISKNYKSHGTHIPVLLKVISMTKGDVCEVGSGFNSTPLLHWICRDRLLVTYENDDAYYRFARQFRSRIHKVGKIDSWDDMDFERHWSVVFIDHRADGDYDTRGMQRGDDALKFKNADILILHDTEPESFKNYRYDLVFPKYKYRCDWTDNKPWTSVVSNVIDVTKWNSPS
jgi:hypothetical protein